MFNRNMMNPGGGQDCWKEMTFGYKFYFFSSLLMLLVTAMFGSYIFIDHPSISILQLQIWRIFFAFYGQTNPFFGVLSILIAFLWMSRLLPHEVMLT